MQTKRLNLVDTAWLNVDTPNAPMQVGGLLTFQIPEDAPADFCQRLVDAWRGHSVAERPWNQRLRGGRWRNVAPEWELLDAIDIEYHFRHSALPAPGGELELGALTSRLHSHPLDLTRPPWECHIIEGLAGNRFALYLKVHHSLIDGVAGMRLLARALSTSVDEHDRPPFWAIPPKKSSRRSSPEAQRPGLYRAVSQLVGEATEQVTSLSGFARILRDMLRTARSGTNGMGLPFAAPSSVLNGRINAPRRYATQLYSLSEFKALAASAGVTINDLLLTVCGTALRRYLDEIGALPDRDLTAGIPVSVRPADGEEEDAAGNAITFIIANLATTEGDTAVRLKRIAESTRAAKHSLEKLSGAAITQYTVALMAPYILSLVSGMAGRTRPVFNVTVSNLPGPREDLYVEGARMEAFFPTSLVTHGQALNITIHGYADTLGFGFIGCRDSLPSLQHIAVYAGEAVEELRALYGKGDTGGPRRRKAHATPAGKDNGRKTAAKRRTTPARSRGQSRTDT
ncbi:wax ester/triacylglycerol synthase family O-acyltransferase [Salinisphaera sp. Q1T1-3]|uniref:WS/DGAT/MGAT family O-acyltransferase n=1 Tax=Salinisphaera sp. Q1T1-3 TaxID=2321229 RepID=UPI000E7715DE|nr:wax ester/triacylglycerol synthase family O-acyltransferase [Salinisphaera sp. Q1T1-3]RJS93322.1 wax ester/triacylglycerol synthase family O-acyltransferase [Salinisphaera sp. Q1T1-3]